MHGVVALESYGPDSIVENTYAQNSGDGIVMRNQNFTLRGVYFKHMRDDCVENDYLHSGIIDDSLFEGCYSGFSTRPSSTNLGTIDGSQETMTIQNSLAWLEPMQEPYKGTSPNTSGFFKWDKTSYSSSPKLVLKNNVFRADMVPADGNLCLNPMNKLVESSNNVIVWLGGGTYPCLPLPLGFTLTTDRAVWDRAVTDWKTRHGYR
jgi:hypothetical protein